MSPKLTRPLPTTGTAPPPLPPRRRTMAGPVGTIYNSPFGGGIMSPYSGGNMFGNMSSMGYPYSPMMGDYGYGGGYGGGGDPNSPFHSVESIVRAISSLSMMVESTYRSMYMSFRAVLGVADNMDQLRRVFFDIFGSLTLVKTFVWFVKKILYVVGLLKTNPVREKAWEAAAAEVAATGPAAARSGRTWPLVAFFGLMLGGPYVLYKLATPPGSSQWNPQTEGGVKCVAIHDFETDQPGELPFRRGEVILRRPQAQGGWVMATKKGGQMGLVPADRLKPVNNIAGGAQQAPQPAKPNLPEYGYHPAGVFGPFGPHVADPQYYPQPMAPPMGPPAPGSTELNPSSVPLLPSAAAAAPQSSISPSVAAPHIAITPSAPSPQSIAPPAAPSQSAVTPQPPNTDSPSEDSPPVDKQD